tara:strand:- start:71 stop:8071 length:8001 start_codon:yes stop_codon:yes gene_type:complete
MTTLIWFHENVEQRNNLILQDNITELPTHFFKIEDFNLDKDTEYNLALMYHNNDTDAIPFNSKSIPLNTSKNDLDYNTIQYNKYKEMIETNSIYKAELENSGYLDDFNTQLEIMRSKSHLSDEIVNKYKEYKDIVEYENFSKDLMYLINNYKIKRIDLLSCNIDNMPIISGLEIRYSLDQTGNDDGESTNWVLESHGVNIKDIYFSNTDDFTEILIIINSSNVADYFDISGGGGDSLTDIMNLTWNKGDYTLNEHHQFNFYDLGVSNKYYHSIDFKLSTLTYTSEQDEGLFYSPFLNIKNVIVDLQIEELFGGYWTQGGVLTGRYNYNIHTNPDFYNMEFKNIVVKSPHEDIFHNYSDNFTIIGTASYSISQYMSHRHKYCIIYLPKCQIGGYRDERRSFFADQYYGSLEDSIVIFKQHNNQYYDSFYLFSQRDIIHDKPNQSHFMSNNMVSFNLGYLQDYNRAGFFGSYEHEDSYYLLTSSLLLNVYGYTGTPTTTVPTTYDSLTNSLEFDITLVSGTVTKLPKVHAYYCNKDTPYKGQLIYTINPAYDSEGWTSGTYYEYAGFKTGDVITFNGLTLTITSQNLSNSVPIKDGYRTIVRDTSNTVTSLDYSRSYAGYQDTWEFTDDYVEFYNQYTQGQSIQLLLQRAYERAYIDRDVNDNPNYLNNMGTSNINDLWVFNLSRIPEDLKIFLFNIADTIKQLDADGNEIGDYKIKTYFTSDNSINKEVKFKKEDYKIYYTDNSGNLTTTECTNNLVYLDISVEKEYQAANFKIDINENKIVGYTSKVCQYIKDQNIPVNKCFLLKNTNNTFTATNLPSGLSIDSNTGNITGIPTETRVSSVVTVNYGSLSFDLDIAVDATTGIVNNYINIDATTGLIDYNNTTQVTGVAPIISWTTPVSYQSTLTIANNIPSVNSDAFYIGNYSIQPALPDGLILDPITGVISGTPKSTIPISPINYIISTHNGNNFTISIEIITNGSMPTNAIENINTISPKWPTFNISFKIFYTGITTIEVYRKKIYTITNNSARNYLSIGLETDSSNTLNSISYLNSYTTDEFIEGLIITHIKIGNNDIIPFTSRTQFASHNIIEDDQNTHIEFTCLIPEMNKDIQILSPGLTGLDIQENIKVWSEMENIIKIICKNINGEVKETEEILLNIGVAEIQDQAHYLTLTSDDFRRISYYFSEGDILYNIQNKYRIKYIKIINEVCDFITNLNIERQHTYERYYIIIGKDVNSWPDSISGLGSYNSPFSNSFYSIEFEDGCQLTHIGKNALKNFPKYYRFDSYLNNTFDIILPDSIEIIGDNAFESASIINLKLSKNIKNIGKQAFKNLHLKGTFEIQQTNSNQIDTLTIQEEAFKGSKLLYDFKVPSYYNNCIIEKSAFENSSLINLDCGNVNMTISEENVFKNSQLYTRLIQSDYDQAIFRINKPIIKNKLELIQGVLPNETYYNNISNLNSFTLDDNLSDNNFVSLGIENNNSTNIKSLNATTGNTASFEHNLQLSDSQKNSLVTKVCLTDNTDIYKYFDLDTRNSDISILQKSTVLEGGEADYFFGNSHAMSDDGTCIISNEGQFNYQRHYGNISAGGNYLSKIKIFKYDVLSESEWNNGTCNPNNKNYIINKIGNYNATKKYWKLEGELILFSETTGDAENIFITLSGDGSHFVISNLDIDNGRIMIFENKQLTLDEWNNGVLAIDKSVNKNIIINKSDSYDANKLYWIQKGSALEGIYTDPDTNQSYGFNKFGGKSSLNKTGSILAIPVFPNSMIYIYQAIGLTFNTSGFNIIFEYKIPTQNEWNEGTANYFDFSKLIILDKSGTYNSTKYFWVQIGKWVYSSKHKDTHLYGHIYLSETGKTVLIPLSTAKNSNKNYGSSRGLVRVYDYKIPSQTEWNNGIDDVSYTNETYFSDSDNNEISIVGKSGAYDSNSTKHYWVQRGNNLWGDKDSSHYGAFATLAKDGNTIAIAPRYFSTDTDTLTDPGLVRMFSFNESNKIWESKGNDFIGINNEKVTFEVSYGSYGRPVIQLSYDGNIIAISSGYGSTSKFYVGKWNGTNWSFNSLSPPYSKYSKWKYYMAAGGISMNLNGNQIIAGSPYWNSPYVRSMNSYSYDSRGCITIYDIASQEIPTITYENTDIGISYSPNKINTVSIHPIIDKIPTSFSISEPLSSGLSFNTLTGVIEGIPTQYQETKSYDITATNETGSSTVSIQITIESAIARILSYTESISIYYKDQAITVNEPTFDRDTKPKGVFSITPALEIAGLSLNTSTGILSGIPTEITTQYNKYIIRNDYEGEYSEFEIQIGVIDEVLENYNKKKLDVNISGTSSGDYFGRYTAISDNNTRVAITSFNDTSKGYVKLYKYNNSNLELIQTIDGINDNDRLGVSTSFSEDGNIFVVGNYNKQVFIYIYKNGDDGWKYYLEKTLTQNIASFGRSLSISSNGNVLAIGVPYFTNGSDLFIGKVIIYRTSDNWTTTSSEDIVYDDVFNYDYFGRAVSISSDGNHLAVGTSTITTNSQRTCSIVVYNYDNGSWIKKGNQIPGINDIDKLGKTISISADGNTIAFGSCGVSESQKGWTSVYEYRIVTQEEYNMTAIIDNSPGLVITKVVKGSTVWNATEKFWVLKGNLFNASDEYYSGVVSLKRNGDRVVIGYNPSGVQNYIKVYTWNSIAWDLNCNILEAN